ncbi:hypothetical protein PFY01_08540 [Brevundimonas vesicularis]|uniref:hypothetical protein n=1 Tax=Brevundimonas vesicularis TaxID=41276 RepID=UPI0022EC2D72|nr:hypothetical protein [Brevundimonas vesicularis]WBT04789.1 hypothetical protein PFY01_08540 [Brevundimonas vesicularis]
MGLIPADRFRTFAPKATAGTREALEAAAAANGFSGLVLAHWLGQMFVESAGFTTREENLNYSVDGLLRMFGRHRISEADARKFGRAPGRPAHQNAIANIIYGGEWGRKNLGNTEPGDGWRFRGGGEKQLPDGPTIARPGTSMIRTPCGLTQSRPPELPPTSSSSTVASLRRCAMT